MGPIKWIRQIFQRHESKGEPIQSVPFTPALEDLYPDLSDAARSSLLALSRCRKRLGEDLRVHVYRYDSKTFLITSMMRADQGALTEDGTPTVLLVDSSNEDLGRAICEHLLAYKVLDRIASPNTKLTDWPIFKASGAKSVKSFEAKCLYASIVATPFSIDIETHPYRRLTDGFCIKNGFCIKSSVQPVHEDVGAMLRRTMRGVDALRERGLI